MTQLIKRETVDDLIADERDAIVAVIQNGAQRRGVTLNPNEALQSLSATAWLAITESDNAEAIMECEPQSLGSCLVRAAAQDLRLGGHRPQAYLIPRKKKVTLMLSYFGLLDKAYDSGVALGFDGAAVHENDHFQYMGGTRPYIEHQKTNGPRGALIAAWTLAALRGGVQIIEVMNGDDLRALKGASQGGPAWRDWEDQQFLKGCFKRMTKKLPIDPVKHYDLVSVMAEDTRVDYTGKGPPQALIDLEANKFQPTLMHKGATRREAATQEDMGEALENGWEAAGNLDPEGLDHLERFTKIVTYWFEPVMMFREGDVAREADSKKKVEKAREKGWKTEEELEDGDGGWDPGVNENLPVQGEETGTRGIAPLLEAVMDYEEGKAPPPEFVPVMMHKEGKEPKMADTREDMEAAANHGWAPKIQAFHEDGSVVKPEEEDIPF